MDGAIGPNRLSVRYGTQPVDTGHWSVSDVVVGAHEVAAQRAAVSPDGAAQPAGLKKGDIITKINGVDQTTSWTAYLSAIHDTFPSSPANASHGGPGPAPRL